MGHGQPHDAQTGGQGRPGLPHGHAQGDMEVQPLLSINKGTLYYTIYTVDYLLSAMAGSKTTTCGPLSITI